MRSKAAVGRPGEVAAGRAGGWQLWLQKDSSIAGDSPWEAWDLSPKPGTPAQRTRAGKRRPYKICLWKAGEFLSAREGQESARDKGTLSKGQHTQFHSKPLSLGFSGNRAEQTRVWGLWLSGGSSKDNWQDPGAELFIHSGNTIFLGRSTPLCEASSWGKGITPHSGLSLDPLSEAYALLSIPRGS